MMRPLGALEIGIEIEHRIDIAQEGILRIRLIQQADERTSTIHSAMSRNDWDHYCDARRGSTRYLPSSVIRGKKRSSLSSGSFVH